MPTTIDGWNMIRNWLSGGGAGNQPIAISLGSGSIVATKYQSELEHEMFPNMGSRNVLASVSANTSQEVTYSMLLDSTQLIGSTIYEIGLHNAISGATMYHRSELAGITKTDDLEIQFDLTLKVGE